MKKTLVASVAVFAIGVLAISQITVAGQIVDKPQVWEIQEETPPAPQEFSPPIQEESPSDVAPTQEPGSVLEGPAVEQNYWVESPVVPAAPVVQCGRCCCAPCCCPVPTDVVMVDDCGCSHTVCVNLPPCCVGEAPVVTWRNGILGRKIANLCWPCCRKRVKVVIRRFGPPRVWE